MRHLAALTNALAVLALAGCNNETVRRCASARDCRGVEVCSHGFCRAPGPGSLPDAGVVACMHGCGGDQDCREGYACCTAFPGGGACLPPGFCPGTGLGVSPDMGNSCAPGGTACASGETCQGGADFPGNACTRSC